jgi:hypothetical protein
MQVLSKKDTVLFHINLVPGDLQENGVASFFECTGKQRHQMIIRTDHKSHFIAFGIGNQVCRVTGNFLRLCNNTGRSISLYDIVSEASFAC